MSDDPNQNAVAPFDQHAAQLQRDLIEYQQAQQDYAEKMAALQLYVQKYGARIDTKYHPKNAPYTEQPNLGTAVPSWYYLDGRGNRIFVNDMTFDNALALSKGGRGMNVREAHGHEQQEVVVIVPRAKRNPAWHAEYLRRTEEYEAARRRLPRNAGRVAIPDGSRLIGDGLPTQHAQAFGTIGRRPLGGSGPMWEARQAQARIMGSKHRPATAGALTASGRYQAPQLLTQSSNNNNSNSNFNTNYHQPSQVIAAVMAPQQQYYYPPQQQQQQQLQLALGAPPAAASASSYTYAADQQQDAATLQAEAQRLLEQLSNSSRR